MFKTLPAFTQEIDNGPRAAGQVLAQLNLEENLLAHAVGIVACHYEFVFSGAYEAVCATLPFEVVGTVTPAGGVGGSAGTLESSWAYSTGRT